MKIKFNMFEGVRDTYKNRHEPESLRRFAGIYWRTALVVGFVLIVASFFYGVWSLLNVLDELGTTPVSPALPSPAFDRGTLNKTVQALDARQTQFDVLKANPSPSVSDPSR